jgi:hypothetical protein
MESDDRIVDEQAEAAADEAGDIGGDAPSYDGDEEDRAVAEGGGGEAEGFEQSEEELVERTEHFDEHRSPCRDAFTDEAESDRSDAAYSEPDEVDPADGAEG